MAAVPTQEERHISPIWFGVLLTGFIPWALNHLQPVDLNHGSADAKPQDGQVLVCRNLFSCKFIRGRHRQHAQVSAGGGAGKRSMPGAAPAKAAHVGLEVDAGAHGVGFRQGSSCPPEAM